MAKLYFYYSAMNAGKSTTLLQANHNYRERGMKTLLFSPRCDDRFGASMIASRIGIQSEAILFDEGFSFLGAIAGSGVACVLIDEAHFLTEQQVAQLVVLNKKESVPILCYGLRTDFVGRAFPGSAALLRWADELIEIKTICHCGSKATMNLRFDREGKAIEAGDQLCIGGEEQYLSLCMKHFIEKMGRIHQLAGVNR
ncbi:MAG: thymidine kinase [Chlamydiota bacterium]|nr:thymidine kinase [Chlamydiota bacterium]